MMCKFKIPHIIIVSLIVVILLSFGFPSAVMAASNGTTAGSIAAVPTFECIGVTVSYTGDDNQNNSAVLEYRASGGTWKTAPAMYADRANREYRGSIFWLTDNTQYEIKATFNDADGGGSVSTTCTTMNDNPPIGTNYYYVATYGDDNNPGTEAQPFRTIQKAADVVNPGSTVLIREGTYIEAVGVSNSGSADNWITFMPYNDESVTIDGNQTAENLIMIKDKSYIRIRNLNLRDAYMTGITIKNDSHDIIVEGCSFHNCHYKNASAEDGFAAVYLDGYHGPPYDVLIQNNTCFSDLGLEKKGDFVMLMFVSHGVTIRNNTVYSPNFSFWDGISSYPEELGDGGADYTTDIDCYNNTISGCIDDCIQIEGSNQNTRIWGNVVSNSGDVDRACIGIATCPVLIGPTYIFRNVVWMTTDDYSTATKMGKSSYGRVYYYHNTFYLIGGIGDTGQNGFSQTNSGLGNLVSRNNIVYCTRYAIETYSDSDPAFPSDFDYDLLYSTDTESPRLVKWNGTGYYKFSSFQSGSGQELHGLSQADMGFADASSGDFTLQPDSPAVDAGVILHGFNDADSPWPYGGSAPDIGAYEMVPLEPMPPVLAPIGDKTTHPGFTLQFTISATDPNGSSGLIYSANNLPGGAAFVPATRTFTWSPTAGQLGTYPGVHFEVTDGEFTDSEDITINVTENQAPTLNNPGDKTGNEGTALTFTLLANDPDGDTLIYSGNNLPSGANLNPSTGVFSWTPNYSQAGTYPDVQFTVSDSQLTDSKSITITINNTNQPPVLASIGNKTVNEGQTLQFAIYATDPEGDPLTYSASNLPVGASFDTTSRLFAWTPVDTQIGTHPGIHFQVTDGTSTDYENITITVRDASANPPSGGGGGGGGGGGSGGGGSTSLAGMMTGEGKIVIDVLCAVDDLEIQILIPKNTIVKCSDDRNATYIRIKKSIDAIKQAEYCQIISNSYDIMPDGATFDPAATMIIKYDENKIPEGISEDSLYVACYDPDTGTWTNLGGTVDTEANTVTAQIEHLSRYALLADAKPASFQLADFSISNEEILPGDTVTATITVNNKGDFSGTCSVELILDSNTAQAEDIKIAGGGMETVTFTITSDVLGVHHVNIGNKYGEFVVVKPMSPAAFTVSKLNINPVSANHGETIKISALVTNTGQLAGSCPTVLKINDIVVQTQEVNLNGGESATLIFGVTPDTYGLFQVSIGDLQEAFVVKPEPPSLIIKAPESPEVNSFTTAPNYDEATRKLVYAKIMYQISQTYDSDTDTRLIMAVYYNDELLEQVPLLALNQLQADGKTGQLNYIPQEGWKVGEYSFQAELYEGKDLVQYTPLRAITVTAESITKVVSWWTLGAVIGVTMLLIIALISVVIYRRRDMLKYEE